MACLQRLITEVDAAGRAVWQQDPSKQKSRPERRLDGFSEISAAYGPVTLSA
jgi:hypothetical protein